MKKSVINLAFILAAAGLVSCTNTGRDEQTANQDIETQQESPIFEDEGLVSDPYGTGGSTTTDQGMMDPPEGGTSMNSETAASRSGTETITLTVAEDPELGSYIVDQFGNPLYIFTADNQSQSTCYGSCAEVWVPLTAQVPIETEESVDMGRLGTSERTDGQMQITYNNWPLYYYVPAQTQGAVSGHGVGSNNGIWYLIDVSGEPLRTVTSETQEREQSQDMRDPKHGEKGTETEQGRGHASPGTSTQDEKSDSENSWR